MLYFVLFLNVDPSLQLVPSMGSDILITYLNTILYLNAKRGYLGAQLGSLGACVFPGLGMGMGEERN